MRLLAYGSYSKLQKGLGYSMYESRCFKAHRVPFHNLGCIANSYPFLRKRFYHTSRWALPELGEE
jgi:hypothetical protein